MKRNKGAVKTGCPWQFHFILLFLPSVHPGERNTELKALYLISLVKGLEREKAETLISQK